MADEVVYSADLESPQLIEQGRPNVLRCPLRRGGQIEPPVSGTITIYDGTGTVLVAAAVVTIAGGVAQYTTGTFASSDRGMRWRIVWLLTMGDGHVHTFRTSAGLVRTIPYPTLSDGKIYERNRLLNPLTPGKIHSRATLQPLIDNAWRFVVRDLKKGGTWVHLVYDQDGLEEAHHQMTLALLFDELGSSRPELLTSATHHREQYTRAFLDAQVTYDADDDGEPDSSPPARGSLFLCGR